MPVTGSWVLWGILALPFFVTGGIWKGLLALLGLASIGFVLDRGLRGLTATRDRAAATKIEEAMLRLEREARKAEEGALSVSAGDTAGSVSEAGDAGELSEPPPS